MGRKTKYKKEFCDKLIEFFDIEPWEEREIHHYDKSGKKDDSGNKIIIWTDIKILPVRMPTIRKFAKTINVHISNVYEWLNEKSNVYQEEFRDAFTYAKQIRRDWLTDVGLSGSAPPASFKFVAVNCTDMRDKQQTEHTLSKETADLLGLIDGSSKGKLPNKKEAQDSE